MNRNINSNIVEPNPVDLHVGARLRARRKELGISQSDLAESVGLTFQQIQKYERGTNRISASKLHQFAEHMNVPIAYFYDGLPVAETDIESVSERSATDFLLTREGQQLAAAFSKLTPNKRKGVMQLVRSLVLDEQVSV